MLNLSYIPTLANGEIVNVIFGIIVVVFAIVGALFKKKEEQKAERQAEARREEARRQQQPSRRQEGEGWMTVGDAPAQNRPPQRIGGVQTPKPLRPPAPVIENRERLQRIEAANREGEARMRRAQAEAAAQRITPPAPPHAVGSLHHTPSGPAAVSADQTAVRVNLAHRNQALRAIVLHEILAAPKALRQGPELWET
jgi:hypothetical protein